MGNKIGIIYLRNAKAAVGSLGQAVARFWSAIAVIRKENQDACTHNVRCDRSSGMNGVASLRSVTFFVSHCVCWQILRVFSRETDNLSDYALGACRIAI